VLSITQIHAGSATNVIPDEAVLIGTVRTFSTGVLDLIERRMEEMAAASPRPSVPSVDFGFKRNYPPLINHPEQTAFAIEGDAGGGGRGKVEYRGRTDHGGGGLRLHAAGEAGLLCLHRQWRRRRTAPAGMGWGRASLHNGSYDFNDHLLPMGASYWVRLVEMGCRW
jgi:metal-dependent amidase/aminoacylase/carboxypeptidase family protein